MKHTPQDETIRKVLEPLQEVPERDPSSTRTGRAAFLAQAARMRADSAVKARDRKAGWMPFLAVFPIRQRQMVRAFVALALVILVLFGGAGTTLAAAQESLPGESLYGVKLWSEDSLLSLTPSTTMQMEYILDFTDRRLGEIEVLISEGKPIPERVITRLQEQLEEVLHLAVNLEDDQMVIELDQVRTRAESQVQTLASLARMAPLADQPVLTRMQLRLREQLELAGMGQQNGEEFKRQMQQRHGAGAGFGEDTSGSGEGVGEMGTASPEGSPTPGGSDPGMGERYPTGTAGGYGPGPHKMESTPSP